MLAGIMAVSMLAGCKTATEPTEEPEVTPVTGAAAVINAELNDKKDTIEFENDTKLQGVLADYFAENNLQVGYMKNTDTSVKWFDGSAGDSSIDTVVQKLMGASGKFAAINASNTSEKTYAEVYALNGKMLTEENALKLVGQYIDGAAVTLPDDSTSKTFDYSGTVAAMKAETKGGTESVWVVAVTITQTPADK